MALLRVKLRKGKREIMKKYDFKKIEAKWQKKWREKKVFKVDEKSKKPKFYELETFPYPSGAGLHIGHPKGYTAEDLRARFMRMNGYEVLYTMGWDAFGLPTENYAIKVNKNPREVAAANVKNFKRQVQMFGFSYDWDREINTASPEYYKWTQWLFIQLFRKGLAYRAKAKVNWCPNDQTVLANEQVVDGKCERCGAEIEQKEMEQWFFRITDYADRLLADLEGLDWPASTIKRQEDWIGKSEGAEIEFRIKNKESGIKDAGVIRVFTTRPETIFGATFLVISPELAAKWIREGWQPTMEVESYIKKSLKKKELERIGKTKDKSGIFTGVQAVNPATKKEIPIWVADYVLAGYGTGAIMAVPAHDERDFEFAKKYKLLVKRVVEPKFVAEDDSDSAMKPGVKLVKRDAICAVIYNPKNDKYLCVSWKKVYMHGFVTGGVEDGENIVVAAMREIKEETGYKNVRLLRNPEFAIHSFFYHRLKNENRWARFNYLFFSLENEEQDKIADHEAELHDLVWKSRSELENFFSVIEGKFVLNFIDNPDYIHVGAGLLHDSGKFEGMDSEEVKWEITKFVGGERKIQYKLRDWSVSRQRYWGVPIPIIYCNRCWEIRNSRLETLNKSQNNNSKIQNEAGNCAIINGRECAVIPVPDEDLPVLLPDLKDYRPKGMPPLASSKDFIKVKCPVCGGEADRDAETLDTFVDSSWYFLRYTDSKNSEKIFDSKLANKWLPIDLYVIGAEHTVLHLLYSRFITKFLKDEGYLRVGEPFKKLRHVGLIKGADGQKMSKSRGNVVNPDELHDNFGADAFRTYLMFMGPFDDGQPWDPQGIIGIERFLRRFYDFVIKNLKIKKDNLGEPEIILLNKTIKKVGEDIKSFNFNTSISALMILLNNLENKNVGDKNLEMMIKLIHPFAPHLGQELWAELGHKTFLDFERWPEFNATLISDRVFVLVVQVNGKARDSFEVPVDIREAEAKDLALDREKVRKFIEGKEIKKTIFVAGRLISFVV